MKKNKLRLVIACVALIIALAVVAVIQGVRYYKKTHFLKYTIIENVDCSYLELDEAIDKINLKKGNELIYFEFVNGKSCYKQASKLGVRADEAQIVRIFNEQHENPSLSRKYILDGFILTDEKLLRDYFATIPELQVENMVEPQDAYIEWDGTRFFIQKEVYGNVIDIEEAVSLAKETIRKNEQRIDFTAITKVNPNVYTADLIEARDELNAILNSVINFELTDGTIVTLDHNIIKKWVSQDDNGNYVIDTENGVKEFISYLDNKVNEANSYFNFAPTNYDGIIALDLPAKFRAYLDEEREYERVLNLLGNPQPITIKPIYDRTPISELLINYVELDISRQHVWFYKNGSLVVDTKCVTGNVSGGYDTPTGIYKLLNKDLDATLEGQNSDGTPYSAKVKYWMRFYEGYGFHDALWRKQFGGSIYKHSGSHGCVNLPLAAAEAMYENFDDDTIIIIYQSEL